MIWTPLGIPGAWLIKAAPEHDARGSYARIWDGDEAVTRGLESRFVQAGVSMNLQRGTVRGLHFQHSPWAETKLVRCVRGAIFDVIVNLHTCQVVTLELDDALTTLYVPASCAHGFQSLTDYTELAYQMSAPYRPTDADGIRWNDPALAIHWPLPVTAMSERDRSLPCLTMPCPTMTMATS